MADKSGANRFTGFQGIGTDADVQLKMLFDARARRNRDDDEEDNDEDDDDGLSVSKRTHPAAAPKPSIAKQEPGAPYPRQGPKPSPASSAPAPAATTLARHAEEEAAEEGACDNYRVDIIAATFGTCRCGFRKAAHQGGPVHPTSRVACVPVAPLAEKGRAGEAENEVRAANKPEALEPARVVEAAEENEAARVVESAKEDEAGRVVEAEKVAKEGLTARAEEEARGTAEAAVTEEAAVAAEANVQADEAETAASAANLTASSLASASWDLTALKTTPAVPAPVETVETPTWVYLDPAQTAQYGPVTPLQCAQLYLKDQLMPGSLMWKEGRESWQTLSEIPELYATVQHLVETLKVQQPADDGSTAAEEVEAVTKALAKAQAAEEAIAKVHEVQTKVAAEQQAAARTAAAEAEAELKRLEAVNEEAKQVAASRRETELLAVGVTAGEADVEQMTLENAEDGRLEAERLIAAAEAEAERVAAEMADAERLEQERLVAEKAAAAKEASEQGAAAGEGAAVDFIAVEDGAEEGAEEGAAPAEKGAAAEEGVTAVEEAEVALPPPVPVPVPEPSAQVLSQLSEHAWFYLSEDGERQGPLHVSLLVDLCADGIIKLDTPVWSKLLGEWKALELVGGLSWMVQRAGPSEEAPIWFALGNDGTRLRPLTMSAMRPLLAAAILSAETAVWSQALGEWQRVSNVRALAAML